MARLSNEIDVDAIRRLFDYDASTGRLRWKEKASRSVIVGSLAGGIHKPSGRIRVGWNRNLYLHSRLVWAWHNGSIAAGMQVDHIDGDVGNDRIVNLQLLSNADNNRRSTKSRGSSGYRGVYFDKRKNKWIVRLDLDGVHINLGGYMDERDAASAYETARRAVTAGKYVPPDYVLLLPPVPDKLFEGKGWKRIQDYLRERGDG